MALSEVDDLTVYMEAAQLCMIVNQKKVFHSPCYIVYTLFLPPNWLLCILASPFLIILC